MEINVGKYKLVHSGFVIGIKNESISIKLPDNVEGDYTFIFKFITDKNNPHAITNCISTGRFTLNVELINFDGFNGGGSTDLISVGTLEHKQLFFCYRIFDLHNVSKTMFFNFYTLEDY